MEVKDDPSPETLNLRRVVGESNNTEGPTSGNKILKFDVRELNRTEG